MEISKLIEQVREGHTDSFEPIIRMYEPSIFRYCCFLLGNKQEAEDAVQDIFFQAYRHLDKVDLSKPFRPWLHKIAQNHCRNMLRRRRKWFHLLPLFRSDTPAKSAEQIVSEQLDDGMAYWFRGLSAEERHILVLRVVEDYSFEEIGRIMDEKPSTIRKRFERLRRKLMQKHPKQEEVMPHGQQYELR